MKNTIKKLERDTQEVNSAMECGRQESAHKVKLLNKKKLNVLTVN